MRIIVVHKNTVVIFSVILLMICGLLAFNWDNTVSVLAPKRDLPIYCVDKQEKIISISFDAAWGNEDTQTLIDILEKYKVKTTFFVVGAWVDKFPESVKALSDAGHEVMNHSNTHPHMTNLSNEKLNEELNQCDEKIQKITGKKPFLFRPPYGDYNDKVVKGCRDLGHYTIQWDVDSMDWKDVSADYIYDRVTKKVKNGSIVLFHNAAKFTPQALPGILENLQNQGYKIVPISQLIFKDSFHMDNSGKQIQDIKETGSLD